MTSSPGPVLARAVGAGVANGALAGTLLPVVLVVGTVLGGGADRVPPDLPLGLLALLLYGCAVGAVAGGAVGTAFGIGLLPLLPLLRGAPRSRVALLGGLLGLAVAAAVAGVLHAVGTSGAWWWMSGGTTLVAAPVVGAWRGPWIVAGPRDR
ncbi:hypothetical protein GCM10017691_52350 [Pseudonocardia petroleophila]|uniref:Uncharacterized protein n=1 Tax=Pseudonocardia petroleophila TaxID=37331 RepID=A0A7G7MPE4_9PSEU|nr:hypothetical protein [Pseudonocardia petroleophila]QNG54655.1 hypothetical protein H6H00_12660 [Pseudonocardia petroleophila]